MSLTVCRSSKEPKRNNSLHEYEQSSCSWIRKAKDMTWERLRNGKDWLSAILKLYF